MVLSICIPIAILVALHSIGTPSKIIDQVPDDFLTITGGDGVGHFISLFLGFVFGETLVQPYAQRAFAGGTRRIVRQGFVYAGLFGLVFLFATSTGGILARVKFPNIDSDAAIPEVIAKLMPAGLTGIAIAAFLAVIMSSASSFLNATTVVVVRDLWTAGGRRSIEDHVRLRLQRIINVVIGALALVIALSLPNIIDILMVYYSAWAPTVIVPLVLGVLVGYRHRYAGISAMLAGLAAVGVWGGVLDDPFGILGLAVGLVTNLVVFFVVLAVTNSRDMAPKGYDIVAQPAQEGT